MLILTDTSVWIDYFKTGANSTELDILIDENIIAINDIILSEIIPFLKIKRQNKIIDLLYEIRKLKLKIDWNEIIQFQVKCLKSGIHGIGIPDLLIAQNSIQNKCKIFTQDKHFKLIKPALDIDLFEY